jgi:hypothetical protein
MATTEYDFALTRNQIIERAFRIVGALPLGQPLDGDNSELGVNVLNDMVKSWQTKHIFLWALEYLTFNTVIGTASYSLSTDPPVMWVDKVWHILGNNDYELESLSYRQYLDIPDKTNAGDPTFYSVNNEHAPTIYLYPVPVEVKAIKYLGITRMKDAETADSALDFPVRWTNALVYGLASYLSDEFKLPLNERGYLRNKAEEEFALAKRTDRERTKMEYIKGAF